MEILNFVLKNLEVFIKLAITILICITFFKTWKVCENEIKHHQHNLDLQYDCLRENEKRANEFYITQCKIDSLSEADIKLYNLMIKDYNERFFKPIKQQNEYIRNLQTKVFDLRKNEWKCLWPFLTALGLMWLGVKF